MIKRPMGELSFALGTVGTLLLLAVTALAQQPWQHLQNPTAAELKKAWLSPPPEYGPEPYYGLNGPADEKTVAHDLDTMKALGYGAVTVQAGYGMRSAYLSPEYFAFFRMFVAAAKERNLRLWIVDDAGYPSGFAGGKFSQLHPELRMQALAVARRIPAHGGELITESVGDNTEAVSALSASDGTQVVVPVSDRQINWKVPAGEWTVVIVEHRFSTSPTRSDTNPQRVKDGSQSLEDYLDPAATAQYLLFTHEEYKKYVGDEFGRTILGFRGDEPDYSIAGLPWTPKFFARFQSVKGYDVRPFLASFLQGPNTVLSAEQRRAKADYYDVFSQMFRDGFFKPQSDWCAQNHLEYQVHLNHEEMELQLTRSEGSFFRDMQAVQLPGIDSIWHQIWTDTVSDFPRLASSVAHVYGRPRAFTESFAAYRPEPTLPLVRYILDEQFVRGVNLVETMYYPATSSPGGRGGGPAKYMQDPAYPALLTYVRRMSFLLSQGRPDASVALYLPSSSLWLGDVATDAQFVSAERMLSERQIDFDVVDEDFLEHGVAQGMATLSGNSYRTVILPNLAVISEEALARLHRLADGGGKVLFLGRTPALIAGKTILDSRGSTAADFKWASVTPEILPVTPTPPAQPPASAPEAMLVQPATVAALRAAVGVQDAMLEHDDTAVRMMHRKLKDAEVYLFFNESDKAISDTVRFAAKERTAERWDAATGNVSIEQLAGGSVPLQLGAYETRILVVR